MAARRVYLPLQDDALSGLAESGVVPLPDDGAIAGYAVTRAVAAEIADGDEEEREYDALLEAAAHAGESAAGRRRVVAAADLLPPDVEDVEGGYAQVRVTAPVRLDDIMAFHVDETVEHSDADLLWYDVSELSDVRALLLSGPGAIS